MTTLDVMQRPSAERALAADVPRGTCVAIVVHWIRADDTVRCVRSIRADAPGLPVIIVDNASEDGSGAAVGRALADLADVEVLRAARNGGFGAGCNSGFERALAAFPRLASALLLNPDAVVEPGAIAALLALAARQPQAGIVGGTVLDEAGAAVLFESGRFRPATLGRSHVAAPRAVREHQVTFVTGAFMLVDAGLLRDGLRFDERYFLYVEDMDLCCQARARGRTLWVTRDARVRHREGSSQADDPAVLGGMRSGQLENIARGKAILARKWLSRSQRLTFLATALLVRPLCGIVLARGVRFLRPYFRGLRAGLREPLS